MRLRTARSEVRILSGASFPLIMMILEVFCCGPIETKALLVGCPKSRLVAIIDAPLGSVALLENRIRELGLTVSVILLTHSHWDHIAEAALLKEKFKKMLATWRVQGRMASRFFSPSRESPRIAF
jgi:glyoxylase-like metal-dependent hydrolase (beta-lactamase superfamily II)